MFGCVSREASREPGNVPCITREPNLVPQPAATPMLQKNDMLTRDEIAGMMQECIAQELRPLQKEIATLREDIGCQTVLQAITEMRKQYDLDGAAIKGLCSEVERLLYEPKMRAEAVEKKNEVVEQVSSSELSATSIRVDLQDSGVKKQEHKQTPLVKALGGDLGDEIPEPEKDGSFDPDQLATVLKSSLREVLPDLMTGLFLEHLVRASPAKQADDEVHRDMQISPVNGIADDNGGQGGGNDAGGKESMLCENGEELVDDIVEQQISEIVEEQLHEKSLVELLAQYIGCGFGGTALCARTKPTDVFAHSVETRWFACMETLLIVGHTILVAYETDVKIKAELMTPPGQIPKWFKTANITFSIVFGVELAYRIAALRTWFFVSPYEKSWNMFDFIVVGGSLIAESLNGPSFKFVRTLRLFRMVRILSVVKYFRELRRIMHAVLANMYTMLWSFVFLCLLTFMASLVMLQGLVDALGEMDIGSSKREVAVAGIQEWWYSLTVTMINLVAIIAGAGDWLEMRQPLNDASKLYSYAFVVYQCILIICVLNILTGVFLESSQENKNQSMIVQGEQIKEEVFSRQMLAVFKQMDTDADGVVDEQTFRKAVQLPDIKAALSSYHILPKHTHVLFEMLDESNNGTLSATEFVAGMMDLKGEANAMDIRLVLQAIKDVTVLKDKSLWSTG